MKLFYHPDSPFVRKVLLVAHEGGVLNDTELLPAAAHPVQPDRTIAPCNPLAQVPTFVTDDGQTLSDSSVICEYLDTLANAGLFPQSGAARWRALTNQALADGLILSAVQARYELLIRPEDKRWDDWHKALMNKVHRVLDHFERGDALDAQSFDIGTLTLACALGYLDHRYKDLGWRSRVPGIAAWFETVSMRPSVASIRFGVDLRQEL